MVYLSTIQNKLKQVKPHLVSKYHTHTLGLFGSIVRKDFTSKNDIDISVDFTRPVGVEFIDLANELESILSRIVDLISKTGIKPGYFQVIQPEILYV